MNPTPATLEGFLRGLSSEGLAAVSLEEPAPAAGSGFGALLEELGRRAALEFPGPAPELEPEAALEATRALYRLCSEMLRGRPAEGSAPPRLPAPPTPPSTQEAAFSADLCLRWLPDLGRRALWLELDDPRLRALRELGRAFPLSSVGMPDLGPLEPGALASHEGLLQLYVDRCLARGAPERLVTKSLLTLARAAAGGSFEPSRLE